MSDEAIKKDRNPLKKNLIEPSKDWFLKSWKIFQILVLYCLLEYQPERFISLNP